MAWRLHPTQQHASEAFLNLTKNQAISIGAAMRPTDNVGSRMSFRGLKTDRAISYKMRATWLAPEVVRATARLVQLNERLSPQRARELVAEAEAVGDTVFLIELDPNEGSGVIPLDWTASLQPKDLVQGNLERSMQRSGSCKESARSRVFSSVTMHTMFWTVFRLRTDTGAPLFGEGTREAELVISIQGREGGVSWPIPDSIRKRLAAMN